MASNFSANQYEREFTAKRLNNWEVAHWYPKHPRRRTSITKIIADDKGHLLPSITRPSTSPWGRYLSTWQLPKRITKERAFEINAPQLGGSRWALPTPKSPKVKQEKEDDDIKIKEEPETVKPELKEEVSSKEIRKKGKPKREFHGKEKLNHPIAVAQQQREIRHETLERDNDEH